MDVMGGDDNGYGSHTNLRVPATFQKHTERTIWKNNLKEYHPPKPQLKALMGYAQFDDLSSKGAFYHGDEMEVKCARKCRRFNRRSPFGYKQYRRCKARCGKSLQERDSHDFGGASDRMVDPDVFRHDFVSFDQDNRSDECHSICHKHMKLAKCKFTRTYEHCVIEKKIGYENCKYGCLSISMRGNEY